MVQFYCIFITLSNLSKCFDVFDDIEVYLKLSMITGVSQWPDFDISKRDLMQLLELTVRFYTNIAKNFDRKGKLYNLLKI